MVKESDAHTNAHPCAQCAEPITDEDESVECFGQCKRTIHPDCLPGATAEDVDQLRKINNAVFVCDECYALHEYEDGHWKKSLDEIHKKINELACVVDFVKNFEQKVRAIVRSEIVKNKNSVTVQNENKDNAAQPENKEQGGGGGRVLRSATKKNKPDTVLTNGSNIEETPKSALLFSEVAKLGREKRATLKQTDKEGEKQFKKPDPVIVIKPKQGTATGSTRDELKKKVNPKNLNVSRVYEGKDGAVMVVLKDKESSVQLEANVKKAMGDKFDVGVRESIKPTIKIVGMNEEYQEDELKETMVSQNDVLQGVKHFKLRKLLTNPKRQYAQYSAIVELDAATFFKVIKLEKLNVGWDRCRVFDGVDVLRCFKCCGFNHKGADCKAEREICPICSGEHPLKECKATEEKCVSCEKYRVERKLDIPVDHAAWSTDCPVYVRFKKRRDRQVDFTM